MKSRAQGPPICICRAPSPLLGPSPWPFTSPRILGGALPLLDQAGYTKSWLLLLRTKFEDSEPPLTTCLSVSRVSAFCLWSLLRKSEGRGARGQGSLATRELPTSPRFSGHLKWRLRGPDFRPEACPAACRPLSRLPLTRAL